MPTTNNADFSVQLKKTIFTLAHPLWRLYDALVTKHPDHWAFATHHLNSVRFVENQRALFEYVKADKNIRKIVFYRGRQPEFQIEGAVNYEIVTHGSLRSFILLARCKVVFVTHSISMDFSLRWGSRAFSVLKLAMKNRLVVNLWHGIPLKRLLYAANEETRKHTDRVKYRKQERRNYAGLIASSDIDSYAMSAMFYPLSYRQIWITGLPRNDFLVQKEGLLPLYIRESIDVIRKLVKGRRLIVYAPTYRQTAVAHDAHYYQFTPDEIASLATVLRRHDAVLGYRPHYFKNTEHYFNLDKFIDNDLLLDLSSAVVPEFSAVARECDLLLTDYSSVYIESLYLGRPVISFAYDFEHYQNAQDGLLYDMSLVFPGPVCRTFSETVSAIDAILWCTGNDIKERQEVARKIFFKYRDADNSKRVAEMVKESLKNCS